MELAVLFEASVPSRSRQCDVGGLDIGFRLDLATLKGNQVVAEEHMLVYIHVHS